VVSLSDLEYSSQFWSLHLKTEVVELFHVQRMATKTIQGIEQLLSQGMNN